MCTCFRLKWNWSTFFWFCPFFMFWRIGNPTSASPPSCNASSRSRTGRDRTTPFCLTTGFRRVSRERGIVARTVTTAHLIHERLGLGEVIHARVLLRRDSSSIVLALSLDRRYLKAACKYIYSRRNNALKTYVPPHFSEAPLLTLRASTACVPPQKKLIYWRKAEKRATRQTNHQSPRPTASISRIIHIW